MGFGICADTILCIRIGTDTYPIGSPRNVVDLLVTLQIKSERRYVVHYIGATGIEDRKTRYSSRQKVVRRRFAKLSATTPKL